MFEHKKPVRQEIKIISVNLKNNTTKSTYINEELIFIETSTNTTFEISGSEQEIVEKMSNGNEVHITKSNGKVIRKEEFFYKDNKLDKTILHVEGTKTLNNYKYFKDKLIVTQITSDSEQIESIFYYDKKVRIIKKYGKYTYGNEYENDKYYDTFVIQEYEYDEEDRIVKHNLKRPGTSEYFRKISKKYSSNSKEIEISVTGYQLLKINDLIDESNQYYDIEISKYFKDGIYNLKIIVTYDWDILSNIKLINMETKKILEEVFFVIDWIVDNHRNVFNCKPKSIVCIQRHDDKLYKSYEKKIEYY
jgi:hypothetical protein